MSEASDVGSLAMDVDVRSFGCRLPTPWMSMSEGSAPCQHAVGAVRRGPLAYGPMSSTLPFRRSVANCAGVMPPASGS